MLGEGLDVEAQRYWYHQLSLHICRRLVESIAIYSWNVGQTQDAVWVMAGQIPTALAGPEYCLHQDELDLTVVAGIYVVTI